MSKYVVPSGMVDAVREKLFGLSLAWFPPSRIPEMLEAAVEWLAKNPSVPNEAQVECILSDKARSGNGLKCWDLPEIIVEWQRRMFLALEPEVPEEIKDLLWGGDVTISSSVNKSLLEAYRRGRTASERS